jgi:hypothetical protein
MMLLGEVKSVRLGWVGLNVWDDSDTLTVLVSYTIV